MPDYTAWDATKLSFLGGEWYIVSIHAPVWGATPTAPLRRGKGTAEPSMPHMGQRLGWSAFSTPVWEVASSSPSMCQESQMARSYPATGRLGANRPGANRLAANEP